MENTKEYLKVLLKCIGILAGGIIAGVILLTLAYCVPINYELRQESYDFIKEEGVCPVVPHFVAGCSENFFSRFPGVLDSGTDSVMLYTAGNERTGSPLDAAMRVHNDYMGIDYTYYWHGYVSVLRPFMYFFNYADIRMINTLGQMLLVAFLAISIAQKKGKEYAVMLLTSYALLMPTALGFSLQFTWVFYISMLASLIIVQKHQYLEDKFRYVYFFLIVGMFTSYFDLLTYPLVTWGFPVVWWMVMTGDGDTRFSYLKKVAGSGVSWIFGYGLMWAGKGIMGDIILKGNILASTIAEALYRSGASQTHALGLADRLEAIYINLTHYSDKVYVLIIAAWIIYTAMHSIFRGLKFTAKVPAFFLIGCSSIVWYLVVVDHTLGHHLFTYRIFSISILAFMAMALEVRAHEAMRLKNAAVTAVCWALIVVASRGLMMCAREELLVWNANNNPVLIPIEEGSIVETSFTPSFSGVKEFGFGMTSNSVLGDYIITLYDEGTSIYQEVIPIKDTLGQFEIYKEIPVDWRFNAGQTYTMRLEVTGNDSPVSVVMTEPNDLPLSEYRNATVDGVPYEGQLLSGLLYQTFPLQREMRILLILTWSGALAATTVTLYSAVPWKFKRK